MLIKVKVDFPLRGVKIDIKIVLQIKGKEPGITFWIIWKIYGTSVGFWFDENEQLTLRHKTFIYYFTTNINKLKVSINDKSEVNGIEVCKWLSNDIVYLYFMIWLCRGDSNEHGILLPAHCTHT